MGDQAVIPQQVCSADKGGEWLTPILTFSNSARRTIESYERELIQYGSMEIRLRDALTESEARLRQQEELIQKQELLSRESDHRLMNDLQMTISLLSLQSRSATNPEAAAQLAEAERFGSDRCICGLSRDLGSGGGARRAAPRALRANLCRTRRAVSPPRDGGSDSAISRPE
jgi:hypothetical protein